MLWQKRAHWISLMHHTNQFITMDLWCLFCVVADLNDGVCQSFDLQKVGQCHKLSTPDDLHELCGLTQQGLECLPVLPFVPLYMNENKVFEITIVGSPFELHWPYARELMSWSVVCPCVNFFFKHLLWNYLSDFEEILQKCSCHGPLQNFLRNFDSV